MFLKQAFLEGAGFILYIETYIQSEMVGYSSDFSASSVLETKYEALGTPKIRRGW